MRGRFGPGVRADGLRNDVTNGEITNNPTPTPENIFAEPSVNDPLLGAQEKIFQLWASTWEENIKLSYNQFNFEDKKPEDLLNTMYVITHTPQFATWYASERDNLLNAVRTSTPLKITWNITKEDINPNNAQQASATKYLGEMEIDNLHIVSQEGVYPPLTDADRQNGISWGGSAQITFTYRSRALEYSGIDGFNWIWGKKSDVDAWVTKDASDPYPPFGRWLEGKAGVYLEIVNGNWQIKQPFTKGAESPDPWDISQGFHLPDGNIRVPLPPPVSVVGVICYNYEESPCIRLRADYSK